MVRVIFYKSVSSKISPKKAQIIAANITYDGKKYTCEGNKNFLGALPPETESPENIITAMRLLPRKYTGGYIRAEFIEGKKKGSSESGHYGHSGLPGVWGGSRPSGVGEPLDVDEGKFIDAAGNNRDEHGEDLGGGINNSILVSYEDDGQGVWKPIHGRLHDGHSEVIVSEVDNILGLDLVPPTVYSEFEGMLGTSQMYVKAAQTGRKLNWEVRDSVWNGNHPDAESIVLLDYIVGNRDRHVENWLLGDNGKLYAIDNGFCSFSTKVDFSDTKRSGMFLPKASRMRGKHTISKSLLSKLKQVVGEGSGEGRNWNHAKYLAFRLKFSDQSVGNSSWMINQVWDRMVEIVGAEGEMTWW